MIFKCFSLLIITQILVATAKPINPGFDDPQQKALEKEAKEETVNLLNSLFRSQIAYFTEVNSNLNPRTKRAADIRLYITRLNQAIAENELDKKDKMWLDIFEEFKGSPLLLNREEETGLTDMQYKILLTGKKLQAISAGFVSDVADYFWKMAKISGKVVENHFEGKNRLTNP
ncbi:uncharacterized protein LOC110186017 [Drosophila serrata]|uniref:uncharacterized protein LOC110186017 n=1 Tax=Drosophila serrata TaxID=7274 RepID=UPI000A1D30CE|nr:uncharacterized protein LOC110186017 [Drosophila serrata]